MRSTGKLKAKRIVREERKGEGSIRRKGWKVRGRLEV